MPRNGSGTYSLPSIYLATPGTTIQAQQHNDPLTDIASALTSSLAADGQTPMTGNLQMNSKKITGLAAATANGDALRYEQLGAFLISASALAMAAGEYIYASGTNIAAKGTISADARTFLAATNFAAMRTALGLSALATATGVTTALMDAATLVTAAEGIGSNNNDTTIPTSAAVKAYADSVGPRCRVNFDGTPDSGTYSRTGTLVTVTITAHGMTTGQWAKLDFTTGTATDGWYQVTNTGANTFTVTDTASGATSGNVTRNAWTRGLSGVSDITRSTTGRYVITWSSAFADAGYVVSMTSGSSTALAIFAAAAFIEAQTTTTLTIYCGTHGNASTPTYVDMDFINITVFA